MSENSTPVRWYLHFGFGGEGDPPTQHIGREEYAETFTVHEDPVLTAEEWSWEPDDWKASERAAWLLNLLNSAPAVEQLIRAARALAEDPSPSAVLHAKDGGGDVGISVNAHAIHRLQRALALLEAE